MAAAECCGQMQVWHVRLLDLEWHALGSKRLGRLNVAVYPAAHTVQREERVWGKPLRDTLPATDRRKGTLGVVRPVCSRWGVCSEASQKCRGGTLPSRATHLLRQPTPLKALPMPGPFGHGALLVLVSVLALLSRHQHAHVALPVVTGGAPQPKEGRTEQRYLEEEMHAG